MSRLRKRWRRLLLSRCSVQARLATTATQFGGISKCVLGLLRSPFLSPTAGEVKVRVRLEIATSTVSSECDNGLERLLENVTLWWVMDEVAFNRIRVATSNAESDVTLLIDLTCLEGPLSMPVFPKQASQVFLRLYLTPWSARESGEARWLSLSRTTPLSLIPLNSQLDAPSARQCYGSISEVSH